MKPDRTPMVVVNDHPTVQEVIDHLEAGGRVEHLTPGSGWTLSHSSAEQWRLQRIGASSVVLYRLVKPQEAA